MTADAALLYEVRYLVAREFDLPPENVAAETDFYTDLDESLELVEVIMACEERWDLNIPDSAYASVTTVGRLADLIAASLAVKTTARR